MAAQEGLDCRNCGHHARIEHGYAEDSPVPDKWDFGYFKTRRCPAQQTTSQSKSYLDAYVMCERYGILDWRFETKKFIEALSIIERESKRNNEDGRR